MKTQVRAHLNDQRYVAPEVLNVSPELVGRPLARPLRRALAMALDLVVVALLSGVSGLWLVGGLAAVVLQLRSQAGATATGMVSKRRWLGWGLAGLLGLLAINEAKDQWILRHDPAAIAAAAAERAAEQAADAAEAAAEAAEAAADAAPSSRRKTAAAPAHPDAALPHQPTALDLAQRRISELEAQLAEAKKPKPFSLHHEFQRVVAAIGLQFGWGIVYFALLPAWWGGQTVGKKVFGLRVAEITGQPMTVMRCLKRYGGYAAGMATGGLGFGQILWDPNRQGIQDKAAHTVVLDLQALSPAVETPAMARPPAA